MILERIPFSKTLEAIRTTSSPEAACLVLNDTYPTTIQPDHLHDYFKSLNIPSVNYAQLKANDANTLQELCKKVDLISQNKFLNVAQIQLNFFGLSFDKIHLAIIEEKAINRATLARVAKRLGVSKNLLQQYFESNLIDYQALKKLSVEQIRKLFKHEDTSLDLIKIKEEKQNESIQEEKNLEDLLFSLIHEIIRSSPSPKIVYIRLSKLLGRELKTDELSDYLASLSIGKTNLYFLKEMSEEAFSDLFANHYYKPIKKNNNRFPPSLEWQFLPYVVTPYTTPYTLCHQLRITQQQLDEYLKENKVPSFAQFRKNILDTKKQGETTFDKEKITLSDLHSALRSSFTKKQAARKLSINRNTLNRLITLSKISELDLLGTPGKEAKQKWGEYNQVIYVNPRYRLKEKNNSLQDLPFCDIHEAIRNAPRTKIAYKNLEKQLNRALNHDELPSYLAALPIGKTNLYTLKAWSIEELSKTLPEHYYKPIKKNADESINILELAKPPSQEISSWHEITLSDLHLAVRGSFKKSHAAKKLNINKAEFKELLRRTELHYADLLVTNENKAKTLWKNYNQLLNPLNKFDLLSQGLAIVHLKLYETFDIDAAVKALNTTRIDLNAYLQEIGIPYEILQKTPPNSAQLSLDYQNNPPRPSMDIEPQESKTSLLKKMSFNELHDAIRSGNFSHTQNAHKFPARKILDPFLAQRGLTVEFLKKTPMRFLAEQLGEKYDLPPHKQSDLIYFGLPLLHQLILKIKQIDKVGLYFARGNKDIQYVEKFLSDLGTNFDEMLKLEYDSPKAKELYEKDANHHGTQDHFNRKCFFEYFLDIPFKEKTLEEVHWGLRGTASLEEYCRIEKINTETLRITLGKLGTSYEELMQLNELTELEKFSGIYKLPVDRKPSALDIKDLPMIIEKIKKTADIATVAIGMGHKRDTLISFLEKNNIDYHEIKTDQFDLSKIIIPEPTQKPKNFGEIPFSDLHTAILETSSAQKAAQLIGERHGTNQFNRTAGPLNQYLAGLDFLPTIYEVLKNSNPKVIASLYGDYYNKPINNSSKFSQFHLRALGLPNLHYLILNSKNLSAVSNRFWYKLPSDQTNPIEVYLKQLNSSYEQLKKLEFDGEEANKLYTLNEQIVKPSDTQKKIWGLMLNSTVSEEQKEEPSNAAAALKFGIFKASPNLTSPNTITTSIKLQ